jgi:hypothetical protein
MTIYCVGGREIEVRNLCDEAWRGVSQALVARVEGFKIAVGTPLWAGGGVGGDGVLRCAQDDNLLFGGREIEVEKSLR